MTISLFLILSSIHPWKAMHDNPLLSRLKRYITNRFKFNFRLKLQSVFGLPSWIYLMPKMSLNCHIINLFIFAFLIQNIFQCQFELLFAAM